MAQQQRGRVTTTQHIDSSTSYDPNNDSKGHEKSQLIENIKSIVYQGVTKPLNVVVLGCPGSGKSSFLNTVFTSLRTDCWTERTRVGCLVGSGQQVTNHVISFTAASDYYQEEPTVLFPTFIDVQGLEDDDSAFNTEFLKALLNGKICNNQSMNELHSIFDKAGAGGLTRLLDNDNIIRRMRGLCKDNLTVDRIIVVASADPTPDSLPKQLIECIHDSMLCRRDIPIFGVLTKADKFERNEDRISTFMNALGITKDRFLLTANYCPDIDQQMQYHHTVFPYIDVPVLQFLKQVVNPDLRVITPNKLFKSDWFEVLQSDITGLGPYLVLQLCLMLFFLYWLSFPPVDPKTRIALCADYTTYAKRHHFEISGLDNLCTDDKNQTRFPVVKVLGFLICIVFVLPLLERHKQRILENLQLSELERRRLRRGDVDVYIYATLFFILVVAFIAC